MLEYDQWGSQGTMILTGDDPDPEQDPTRQNILLNHYTTTSQPSFLEDHHHHNNFLAQQQQQQQQQQQTHLPFNNSQANTFYDPRAYNHTLSPYALQLPHHHNHDHSLLSLDGGGGYFLIPKSEEVSRTPVDFVSRIGLNLGGRTYFSSAEDDFVNRLYRRSRHGELGMLNSPKCQVDGCNADLTHSKHYHRRHKVCEFHSKASTVVSAGLTQRFCQQCSRFHLLSEFDNGKRSCRRRLADHNRRRRKASLQPTNQLENDQNARQAEKAIRSSPPDPGAQSSSSVTVALSPKRMSLDCFRQARPYEASTTSSSSFFSSG
ncbi:hypothetical protein ACFE04_019151 [Oxalis oulophora]